MDVPRRARDRPRVWLLRVDLDAHALVGRRRALCHRLGHHSRGNIKFAPSTCMSPGACGGDPAGAWTVVSGCTQPPASGWCMGALESGGRTASGEYRFVVAVRAAYYG